MANIEQNYDYTDDNIRTLEGVEHIRRRPGMYIGRLGNGSNPGDGIYVLLKEIVDNCIDEFSAGFGKQVIIKIEDRQVSVRDFGRGIPLNSVIKATSQLNTGGKFDDKAFKKSVGLNGVGTKAVNALSESFYVESFRGGESSWARYERGELVGSDRKEKVSEKNGTLVVFTPDSTMFGNFEFNMDYVETMVKNYSYLKKGLAIVLNGVTYKSENGLLDLVNDNLSETPRYAPIHLVGEDIEVVLTHGNSYGENIASFVNGQNTRDGGTHLAAFREAIAKTLKDFFKKNYAPEDCRQGIIGAISIQIQEPNFEGQTKTKLGSTYMWEKEKTDGNGKKVQNPDGSIEIDRGPTIRSYVNDFIAKNLDNYLRINKDIVPIIENKIKESQAEREEIAGIQKKTRERNKKANVYNRKLRDCRFHFCDKLPKGKQESRKKVAENEELNLLVSALGVEDDLDNLRYNNIIVATDADDDGMHIRMLVLTFFMKYYPDLIRRGHVHILQTPLFRVANKKERRYCYSPEEKEAAIKELKTSVQITRFKGLGEISSDEFVDFIGENMRLDLVKLSDEESIADIMEFYMGDNTIDRQNFIRANLRSEEELEDVNI